MTEKNIQPYTNYVDAAKEGTLPSVSWVMPAINESDHPGHSNLIDGQRFVAEMVNAAAQGPDWGPTAIFVVWDDWGGYYDHVAPPKAEDGHRLGMRVPMVLLSPWAQGGAVSSQTLDHSSIPALATSLFDLKPIAPHTDLPSGVWAATPVDDVQIEALSHAPAYEAAGMAHARSVFGLYLLTVLVIVGVLVALGFSMLRRPNRGGS